jgi:hypothetical protein
MSRSSTENLATVFLVDVDDEAQAQTPQLLL